MKKMYQVFEVDVCFTAYAEDTILIGAKDEKDLISHLDDILKDDDYLFMYGGSVKEVKVSSRIRKIENVFTDKPYKKLHEFSYYE